MQQVTTASLPTFYFTAQSETKVKKIYSKSSASTMFTVICPLSSHPSSIFSVECINFDLLKLSQCAFTVRCRVRLSAYWFIQSTEKVAIKGRESAACWLGHYRNTPFHSWMFRKKKPKKLFPFYCCPTSSYFHPTERTKNVQKTWTEISLCLFLSFVTLGNIDLIWAKTMALSSCK